VRQKRPCAGWCGRFSKSETSGLGPKIILVSMASDFWRDFGGGAQGVYVLEDLNKEVMAVAIASLMGSIPRVATA
jgi:hypothetical protein|tara:strand:- start:2761 stop:2985 length:225 start_codon:yes stop_codon:yes gene_type:complete